MKYGDHLYGGTILRIDLSTGKIKKQPTAPYTEKWLGGRGFNSRIAERRNKAGMRNTNRAADRAAEHLP